MRGQSSWSRNGGAARSSNSRRGVDPPDSATVKRPRAASAARAQRTNSTDAARLTCSASANTRTMGLSIMLTTETQRHRENQEKEGNRGANQESYQRLSSVSHH